MRDRVSHRQARLQLVLGVPGDWPLPVPTWLAITREDWAAFGDSELAGIIEAIDMPGLRYLFELRDRRERYLRVTRGRRALANGSRGQDVINPLLKQLPSMNREIRALEAGFGMTPTARRGLTGRGKPTLTDLLEGLDQTEESTVDDPRLRVLAP